VYNLLVVRARENEAIVKDILGPAFRSDKKVELNINVDKRPYLKTRTDKQGTLKKLVQFQIENSLVAGIDLETAKKDRSTAMSCRRSGSSSKILPNSFRRPPRLLPGHWIRTPATCRLKP